MFAMTIIGTFLRISIDALISWKLYVHKDCKYLQTKPWLLDFKEHALVCKTMFKVKPDKYVSYLYEETYTFYNSQDIIILTYEYKLPIKF